MSRIPASYQSFPLTLLSWNISNAQPSFSAPDFTQRSEESPRLIREECLRPTPSPDIIALQECPYPSFGEEEFGQSGYVSMGTQQSHCGYVDLLVRKELAARNTQPIRTVQEGNLPSVAATIVLPNETKIAASSSHLAPFKDGAYQRIIQCMTLMDLLDEQADNCILLGDFNTRAAEDKGIENAGGGGWIDAWKETGSNSEVKFSWNSFANQYHEGGFKFRARFDRSYVRGEALSVRQFGFIGNKCVEKKGDYLSDHFGLLVGLNVANR
ncbi:hypothetical protein ACHAXR_008645 [Thalassiosira sp. AJA248-18]